MPKRARSKPRKKPGRTAPPKPPPDGTRITKAALARLIGVQASLITYHLGKEGAPKPDKFKRYVRDEAERWVRDGMAWAVAATTPATKAMKERLLALELEEKEAAAALRRGETVAMKDISDTISALWVEHESLMRQKFEHELPPKYQGKNEVERRQLNVKALLEIGEAFRSGQTRIENPPVKP